MTGRSSLAGRFMHLPRAARWAITAFAAVALFLLWNDYVLRWMGDFNEQADALLAKVNEVARADQRLRRLGRLQDAVRAHGAVTAPGKEAQAENALNDAVNAVVTAHSVARDSFTYRGPSKLPKGTLSSVTSPAEQVEKITGDLRFDATPEEAFAIIAELESSPEIEAISSVRLTKQPGGKVTVDLTVEAWIVTPQRRGRLGGI